MVRLAFALDCHDREVIGWVATTAGISGEMIRDMMVHCVEQRFGAIRAPHPVQWLSDNGSIFAAHKTIEIAVALNLVPCFTPVESPESNGMAEAFVKTFKRDYVRVSPIPDAATALALVDSWMEDYNTVHPHSRLGYRSPREYITFPTRCVSGLTGSTQRGTAMFEYRLERIMLLPPRSVSERLLVRCPRVCSGTCMLLAAKSLARKSSVRFAR